MLLILFSLFACVLIDVLLVRAAWRFASRPIDAPPAPGRKVSFTLIAIAVFCLVFCMLGAAGWTQYNRRNAIAFANTFTQQYRIRYRIFEIDPTDYNRCVSIAQRTPGDNPGPTNSADSLLSNSPVTTASQTAEISEQTLKSMTTDPESLANNALLSSKLGDSRLIPFPGDIADTWTFTENAARPAAVSGSGFLGVDYQTVPLQLHFAYRVDFNLDGRGIYSARIRWHGPAPTPGNVRAFFIPYTPADTQKYLLIAYYPPDSDSDSAVPSSSMTPSLPPAIHPKDTAESALVGTWRSLSLQSTPIIDRSLILFPNHTYHAVVTPTLTDQYLPINAGSDETGTWSATDSTLTVSATASPNKDFLPHSATIRYELQDDMLTTHEQANFAPVSFQRIAWGPDHATTDPAHTPKIQFESRIITVPTDTLDSLHLKWNLSILDDQPGIPTPTIPATRLDPTALISALKTLGSDPKHFSATPPGKTILNNQMLKLDTVLYNSGFEPHDPRINVSFNVRLTLDAGRHAIIASLDTLRAHVAGTPPIPLSSFPPIPVSITIPNGQALLLAFKNVPGDTLNRTALLLLRASISTGEPTPNDLRGIPATQPADIEARLIGRWESTKIENPSAGLIHIVMSLTQDHRVSAVNESENKSPREVFGTWKIADGTYLRIDEDHAPDAPALPPEMAPFELTDNTLLIHGPDNEIVTLQKTGRAR